jgi:hypothetical protein
MGSVLPTLSTEEEEEALQNYKFTRTFEGNKSRAVAYEFFRAYIQSDIEETKRLMVNPDDTDFISNFIGEERGTMDDVVWLVLKLINNDPLSEIVSITFEFAILPDPVLRYFCVALTLIDDEWKVVTDGIFGLEA